MNPIDDILNLIRVAIETLKLTDESNAFHMEPGGKGVKGGGEIVFFPVGKPGKKSKASRQRRTNQRKDWVRAF